MVALTKHVVADEETFPGASQAGLYTVAQNHVKALFSKWHRAKQQRSTRASMHAYIEVVLKLVRKAVDESQAVVCCPVPTCIMLRSQCRRLVSDCTVHTAGHLEVPPMGAYTISRKEWGPLTATFGSTLEGMSLSPGLLNRPKGVAEVVALTKHECWLLLGAAVVVAAMSGGCNRKME